tara:strand:+ start:564 stop:1457 length:894 start_codon:yes stop_codon:yes gene_type:complete
MSDLRVNNITNLKGDSAPIIAGVCTVSSNYSMVIPSGPTGSRHKSCEGILTDDLKFHMDGRDSYSGDDNINMVYDLSSNGSVGTKTGTVVHTVETSGNEYYNFNGSSYIEFPNPGAYGPSFTAGCWLRFDDIHPDSTQAPFAHGETQTSEDKVPFIIRTSNGASLQFWYEAQNDADYNISTRGTTGGPSNSTVGITSAVLDNNIWYNVNITFDYKTMKQSIMLGTTSYDNLYSNYKVRPQPPSNINNPITVGCRNNSGYAYVNFFKGDISVAYIYDRVLSAEEFTKNHNVYKGRHGY